MGVDALFSYSTLFGFLFTLARISGVFAFLPLAGFRAAPESARIVLSILLTLMLRADWKTPAGAEAICADRSTAPVTPPEAVIVIVEVLPAVAPGAMPRELAARANVGGAADAMVSLSALDALAAKPAVPSYVAEISRVPGSAGAV